MANSHNLRQIPSIFATLRVTLTVTLPDDPASHGSMAFGRPLIVLIALVRKGPSLCISSSARPGHAGMLALICLDGRCRFRFGHSFQGPSRQDTFEERLAEILEQKQQLSDLVMFDCPLADPLVGFWRFLALEVDRQNMSHVGSTCGVGKCEQSPNRGCAYCNCFLGLLKFFPEIPF